MPFFKNLSILAITLYCIESTPILAMNKIPKLKFNKKVENFFSKSKSLFDSKTLRKIKLIHPLKNKMSFAAMRINTTQNWKTFAALGSFATIYALNANIAHSSTVDTEQNWDKFSNEKKDDLAKQYCVDKQFTLNAFEKSSPLEKNAMIHALAEYLKVASYNRLDWDFYVKLNRKAHPENEITIDTLSLQEAICCTIKELKINPQDLIDIYTKCDENQKNILYPVIKSYFNKYNIIASIEPSQQAKAYQWRIFRS